MRLEAIKAKVTHHPHLALIADRRNKMLQCLCDVGAHVSVMSSKVYVELFNETSNLDATIIKLIMGDGRLMLVMMSIKA